jgi:hypothetical protein
VLISQTGTSLSIISDTLGVIRVLICQLSGLESLDILPRLTRAWIADRIYLRFGFELRLKALGTNRRPRARGLLILGESSCLNALSLDVGGNWSLTRFVGISELGGGQRLVVKELLGWSWVLKALKNLAVVLYATHSDGRPIHLLRDPWPIWSDVT